MLNLQKMSKKELLNLLKRSFRQVPFPNEAKVKIHTFEELSRKSYKRADLLTLLKERIVCVEGDFVFFFEVEGMVP